MQGLLSFVKQNNFLCRKSIIFECDDSKTNLVCYERNERHMTSSLYNDCELSPVLCAGSCNSAGQNLGTLGSEFSLLSPSIMKGVMRHVK